MNTNSKPTGFEIAVIGMACRFPGAKNIYEFWNNLKNGVESITFLTDKELKEAGLDEELINNPNYVKTSGGILENKDYFDASFFGYTPTEAEIMDPQIRIFHECVWEALEDAAYDPFSYEGSVGLYAGATSRMRWEALANLSGKVEKIGGFSASHHTGKDFMNTRISYKLNLKGPVVAVQTACSTSLVAIHMACRALLMGECDMALAGGVTVTVKDDIGYLYKKGLVKSPDGHCRAFDADAAGFVGGSGAGAVVLKRLKYAAADNDHIYAVIKGSSINNDGAQKVGYTAPSIEGQVGVIKTALHVSRVESESITYVETHGTATPLGDPVEVEALKQAFKPPTDTPPSQKHLCSIGSVKTNFGHLDSAAGVAGFIKTVLALKHRMIPPSLNFKTPNPKIDFANSPFYVNDQLKEWKNDRYPLRAGVSSFGIGGTNAHVILEEWSDDHSSGAWSMEHGARSHLILLSAKTENALDKMTERLADHFKQNPGIGFADAAYTLQVGRRAFRYRRKLVCSSTAEAVEALSSGNTRKTRTFDAGDEEKPVILMFSGLGAQYVNMGRDLYEKESLFREEMDQCFKLLESIIKENVKEIIYPGNSPQKSQKEESLNNSYRSYESYSLRINQPEIAQMVIFIFEYALAKLIMKWGIQPHAMIGYSFGEYTAACLSGVFSLEDALKLVAARGELVRQTPEGKMLSVPLPEKELKPLLTEELFIAIDNGLSSIITGPAAAVGAFEKQMKAKRCLCMPLQANRAIHSKMMAPILKEFEGLVRRMRLSKPQIPYISNVTGTWIKVNDSSDPRYWARHLGETVRFADGIRELTKEKNAIFLEVGPARDLNALVRRYIEDNPHQHITNLVRHPETNVSDHFYLLNKIGELWLYGKTIDWAEFHKEEKRYRIPLPTYPFEGKRYWIEGDIASYAKMASQISLQEKETDLSQWFYLPLWKQAPLLPKERKPLTGTGEPCSWLVFADSDGPGLLPGKRLAQTGHTVITVNPGPAFEKQNDTAFTVNPADSSHYHDLVKELKAAGEFPGRILHLWGMTSDNGTGTTGIETIKETLDTGFYSLVYLAQAIQKEKVSQDITIDVVTTGMQEIDGSENINPAKAAILGPVKVIPQECPNIRCQSIDISLPASGRSFESLWVDQLLEELASGSEATVIGYRGPYRWERTFEPIVLDKEMEDAAPLKEEGVYLITGGLGNIGFILAQYLAKHYRAKLVLTGRTPMSPAHEWDRWLNAYKDDEADPVGPKIKKIKNLKDLGADVLFFSADAADPEAMGEVIRRAEERLGRINGVVHLAGLVGDDSVHLIPDSGKTQCETQFQSKVYGLPVLEKLFRDRELDFCWLMSSIASVLGGLRFAAYSAANNYMDAFVNHHNRTGRRWIAVNWDIMKPAETAAAFRRILAMEKINRVVVSANGNLQARIDRWIKLEYLRQEEETAAKEKKTYLPRPDLLTPYVAPRNEDEQVLADIFRELFGFEEIGVHDDFIELGGDSIKAITVIYKVHKTLDIEIPLPEFFNRRTVEKVAEFITDTGVEKHAAIEPAEKKEYYLLSSAQNRFYILHRMEPENTAYNSREILELEGEPDKERLEQSFKKLIRRHESFRTSFVLLEGVPVQRIHENVEFPLEFIDAEGTDPDEAIRSFIRPFDLSRGPLARAGLIKTGDRRYLFVVDMNHIISDGISHDLMIQDFISFYRDGSSELPELRLQYKEYCEWQRRRREKVLQQQEAYWLKEFEGEIPVLDIPTDYPRPAVQRFEGDTVIFRIPPSQSAAVKKLAQSEGTTLFMVLLTLYYVLLYRLSGQEDIVIGTVLAGRQHADLEKIIGIFVENLVLRNYPGGEKSFSRFLKEVSRRTLRAFENQEYHYEELVEKIVETRRTDRNPLYDVVLLLQNYAGFFQPRREENIFESDDLIVKSYVYRDKTAPIDMAWYAADEQEFISFRIRYSTKLFKEEIIRRFFGYFKSILTSVLENPEQKIGDIEILSQEERHRLLHTFNDTDADYPHDKTIHQIFEEQVERTPNHIAIIGMGQGAWGTEDLVGVNSVRSHMGEQNLTYKELNDKSDQLAGVLRKKGVKADTIVGVITERSLEMMMAIFGVLKAGGGYLPIDPAYPAERKQYILKDSNAKVLLTTRNLSERIAFEKEIIYLDSYKRFDPVGTSSEKRHAPCSMPHASQVSVSFAYVIYTSGSTGRPKGVLIEHRNVVRLLFNEKFENLFHFSGCDVWTLFHSYCFDFSVWEMYGALLYGGKLVIISPGLTRDFKEYLGVLKSRCVTVLNQTPSAFYLLAAEELNTPGKDLRLRYIIFGGEALHPGRLKEWYDKYPDTRLINMYGITETTVHVTYKVIGEPEIRSNRSYIGRPIPTLTTYVLDKQSHLVPIGTVGELCVAGAGVARGYLNRLELTGEKFDQDFQDYQDEKGKKKRRGKYSFTSLPLYPSTPLYRSGDLGRVLQDGELEYMGRIDHQVKIRGFRVELGEIENRLSNHPKIKEAVVINKEDRGGNMILYAYIVSNNVEGFDNETAAAEELKTFLAKELPDYMIPVHFVPIAHVPLTANGKLDRKALPDPGREVNKTYWPPQNKVEEKLVETWSQILGIDKDIISVDTRFSELGGHSLGLIKLSAEIYKIFQVEMSVMQLFNKPKIKDIAAYIMGTKDGVPTKQEEPFLLLNQKKQENVFLFPPIIGYGLGYKVLANLIPDFSVYAFNFIDDSDRVERYIEWITGIQQEGPYVLSGYSAGGNLAFEVTKQMEAQGHEVSDVIILDTFRSDSNYSLIADVGNIRLIETMTAAVESLGIPFFKEELLKKIKAYTHYIETLDNDGVVNADIHLIRCIDSQERAVRILQAANGKVSELLLSWKKSTKKGYFDYQGFGTHRDLFEPGNLEKNVNIINKIMKKIE